MFRETLWFKRGELVDEEATPLPIEDRYLDDGQVTSTDSFEWGVHTGETRRLPPEVLQACKLDPDDPGMTMLVREMKPSKALIAAAAATVAAVCAVLVFAF